jgi:hypothetical protein
MVVYYKFVIISSSTIDLKLCSILICASIENINGFYMEGAIKGQTSFR